jgi:hypothetical protein
MVVQTNTDNAHKKLYLDSETCGLHSMMVLLQYAVEDGPIHLYNVWLEPVGKTLELLEWIATHIVVGFNLSFDWFHVAKLYTIWSLLPRDWIPVDHIGEIAALEQKGQDGPCIKPANCVDLLLHSRKGPYQSLMARSDVRIRRVPTPLAYALAEELEQRVEIDGIFFAKRADKDAPRWQVFDIKKKDGSIHPDLKDVVLRFNPAGGLKFLAEHALKIKPQYHFEDVELDRSYWPKELGYAPYARAISRKERGWAVYKTEGGKRKVAGYAWPAVIKHHIKHWAENEPAREYARLDIVYTRGLDLHFGSPTPGDNDSVLACMVGIVRWHGFEIDRKGMRKLLREAEAKIAASPVNVNKPPEVRRYVYEGMDETEMLCTSGAKLGESTKKANLIAVSKWMVESPEPCAKCDESGKLEDGHQCLRCGGTGTMRPREVVLDEQGQVKVGSHPAAHLVHNILEVKFAVKEKELYKKLLRARKFHASFNVIGALSSRMSGADGLNAQGIKSAAEVRCLFRLAWEGFLLCGGDFDSFEVTLADAVYNDPDLRRALLAGKKIHALFAMALFPGYTYEEILKTDGTSNNLYTKGKSGVFAMIYGGDWSTLVKNLGVTEEVARAAFRQWNEWFPQAAKARERTFKMFCSMRQPDGTNVIWGEPADYCETFLGFRRYFTLENRIARALFELAKKPPREWRDCKIKVQRSQHKGIQTAAGAVASALYGAAFQIQNANQRAAANHEIQSPGGEITKATQRRVWDLQPAGVHELVVAPMNVHDEILCVTHPDYVEPVAQKIKEGVELYRPQVPLIGMKWNLEMASWAEKKSGSRTMHVTYDREKLLAEAAWGTSCNLFLFKK